MPDQDLRVEPPMTSEEAKLALPILVERAGGVVEFTRAEIDAFAERHGGPRNAGVQIERIPDGLRFTIVHKEVERPS